MSDFLDTTWPLYRPENQVRLVEFRRQEEADPSEKFLGERDASETRLFTPGSICDFAKSIADEWVRVSISVNQSILSSKDEDERS